MSTARANVDATIYDVNTVGQMKGLALGGSRAQTFTAAGAIDPDVSLCNISSSGSAYALTLADASHDGAMLVIAMTAGTDIITISPTNFHNTSLTLNAVGESALLFWVAGKWVAVAMGGATLT